MMSTIICGGCKARFEGDESGESPAFDHHDCPASVEPIEGEEWSAFAARAQAKKRAHKQSLFQRLAPDVIPTSSEDLSSVRNHLAFEAFSSTLEAWLTCEQFDRWDHLVAEQLDEMQENLPVGSGPYFVEHIQNCYRQMLIFAFELLEVDIPKEVK